MKGSRRSKAAKRRKVDPMKVSCPVCLAGPDTSCTAGVRRDPEPHHRRVQVAQAMGVTR